MKTLLGGYQFDNPALLKEALTHSSLSGEDSYERLEFLGDRILSFVIAEWLYRLFPDEDQGTLSQRLAGLVCRETLADIGRKAGLEAYVRAAPAFSAGENDKVMADICESVIAALHEDGGEKPARDFITRWWQPLIHAMKTPPRDARSLLQEWCQAHYGCLPDYEIIAEQSDATLPSFTVELRVKQHKVQARASNKRLAMHRAAALLLKRLEKEMADG